MPNYYIYNYIYCPSSNSAGNLVYNAIVWGLNSLGINTTGGIAWFAHIGGFLVGVVSLKIFQTFHFEHNE
ncbi:hypothetical protein Ct9H90mP29_21900 [bacterium]|nr:MAG: hypothetical protein Ct9H90mP29_21900 [bacterium]